jgi:hypothetical protein
MKTPIEYSNEFRARFGLPELKIDNAEEIEKFKQRLSCYLKESKLINRFPDIWTDLVNKNNFTIYYGQQLPDVNSFFRLDFYQFLEYLEYVLNDCIKFQGQQFPWCKYIGHKNELENIVNDLSTVPISVLIDNNGICTFHPRGDKILDKNLVTDVVKDITDNPHALYIQALTQYNCKQYNDSADNLRKALEAWLKQSLGSNTEQSNIEGIAKGTLQKILNEKFGKTNHHQFITSFIMLFSSYMNIHNKQIKHPKPEQQNSEINEAELEFLLYQTGALIRFTDKMLKYDTR